MEFIRQEGQNLVIQNLFNEEHAGELLPTVGRAFTSVTFRNVGVKVMKFIINALEEVPIRHITLDYNWNHIMMTPKLVCYDKNKWKTLQQLSNWNREWSELFSNCYYLASVVLNFECSWMDKQFTEHFLGGVSKIPNIKYVEANFSSKSKEVEQILAAVSKANIFSQYKHHFKQLS